METKLEVKVKTVNELINFLIDMETQHPNMKFIREDWQVDNYEMGGGHIIKTNELAFEYDEKTNTLEMK